MAEWIDVNKKLPENIKTVLVWYTCYTLFGLSEGYGLSWYSPVTGWYQGYLNGDTIDVRYWHYLPEPPIRTVF